MFPPTGWMHRCNRDGVTALALLACVCLTPGPGVAQERPFPYALDGRDKILAPATLASMALGAYLVSQGDPITLDEITALDRQTVNGLDKRATYNWSPTWDGRADWSKNTVLAASLLVPATSLIRDRSWSDAATVGTIFVETFSLLLGVTTTTKALAGRTRPYAYNTALTPEERYAIAGPEDASVNRSFFSGHSSMAFAAAALLSTVYQDLHGPSTAAKVVWVSSLSLAAFTAYARVEAGMHFPTDVLVGAVVGAAIGHLVPRLHRAGANHPLSVSAGLRSVQLRVGVGGP